jgi:Fe-S cluster assembly protein SufD
MDEVWKYTKIAESNFQDYAWANEIPLAGEKIDWETLYQSMLPPNSTVFVFENGSLVGQSERCPAGITLTSGELPGDLQAYSPSPAWLKVCAEAALSQQGRKWHWIVSETRTEPLYVLHFYTGSRSKQAVFARHCVEIEKGVSATIVEIHGDLYDNNLRGLCYGQAEMRVAVGAQVQHHRLSLATSGMTAIADLNVNIHDKAAYDLRTISSGGKQHRHNVILSLIGDHAKASVKCLHWASHQDSLDTHLEVQHKANYGESDVMIRGVAERRGASSVTGKIVIPEGAAQNSAQLENKNLLLSREATINSRPQLEIYHDNIQRCTHGATVGYLDNEALFYLQSRGIPVAEAKKMLIDSFIEPVLSAFSPVLVDELRAQLLAIPVPIVTEQSPVSGVTESHA